MAFQLPTFKQILARVRADFGGFSDGTTPVESVEYILANIQAKLSKGLYGYLTYLLRQAFYDTAEDSYFWHWFAVFGLEQKQAVAWRGTVTFTGSDGTTIPAATVVQRGDGVLYTTDADVTIASGTATAAVTASVADAASDNADAQPLALGSPIVGVDPDCLVASTTQSGGDVETVDQAKVRLSLQLKTPPSGGGPGDYVRWALATPGVTRAWEFANLEGPNTVSVAFVRDGDGTGSDIVPDSGERATVLAYLEARAPITVQTYVVTLAAVPLDLTLASLTPDNADVRAAIVESVTDLLEREGAPGGTILLSQINEAISAAAGEVDHVLTSPSADVTYTTAEVPVFGVLV